MPLLAKNLGGTYKLYVQSPIYPFQIKTLFSVCRAFNGSPIQSCHYQLRTSEEPTNSMSNPWTTGFKSKHRILCIGLLMALPYNHAPNTIYLNWGWIEFEQMQYWKSTTALVLTMNASQSMNASLCNNQSCCLQRQPAIYHFNSCVGFFYF